MRVARSAGPGVFGEHRGREELVRGGREISALERDVAEQQVRIDLDLAVVLESTVWRRGAAPRSSRRGSAVMRVSCGSI